MIARWLRLVTDDNAHEFAPVPRKRGRPRKIDARDNVVPIGSRRSAAVPVTTTYVLSIDEHARTLAIARSVRDLGESKRRGERMQRTFDEHLAAAYRELGHAPPT